MTHAKIGSRQAFIKGSSEKDRHVIRRRIHVHNSYHPAVLAGSPSLKELCTSARCGHGIAKVHVSCRINRRTIHYHHTSILLSQDRQPATALDSERKLHCLRPLRGRSTRILIMKLGPRGADQFAIPPCFLAPRRVQNDAQGQVAVKLPPVSVRPSYRIPMH